MLRKAWSWPVNIILISRIIDFIPEHHGTSMIHYFYQKALLEGELEGLEEKDYRYPGPKPQSKETAIVLLADSVEAVSDPSTWRWTVAAALDQQRASDEAAQARLAAVKFRQTSERYSTVGVLETGR